MQQVAEKIGFGRERLYYVRDDMPGYRRIRRGRGFSFLGPDGKMARDPILLERFKRLVIPPAWENVWICPNPEGHIQATGRDARGRKQYIYHPSWQEIRSLDKFDRVASFAHVLPAVTERVSRAVRRTSYRLGNTPAVCRRYYIHPRVFESYLDKTLFEVMSRAAVDSPRNSYGLSEGERKVLRLLENGK